jgi:alkylmercury lyase
MQCGFLEHMGRQLIEHLCCQHVRDEILHHAVLQQLSKGRPVVSTTLAEMLGWEQAEVEDRLTHVPDLERDLTGRIVGWGLTLLATPHHLTFHGKTLATWCAFDTLMYPVCLDLVAQVESPCPMTQQSIRCTVSPGEITDVQPPQAILSLVLPGGREDCSREQFCGQSHFFASWAAASAWKRAHPQAILLLLEEAGQLARRVALARQQRCSSHRVPLSEDESDTCVPRASPMV